MDDHSPRPSIPEPRLHLLKAALEFVRHAGRLQGVTRLALAGSMTTAKAIPKDIDILVTIASRADTRAIAGAARKLKGQTHYITLNADVFLVDAAGNCIGRTCPFREPSPRARCWGLSCGHDTHVCDDTADLKLARDLILAPPIELWPQVVRRVAVPADVESILLAALELPEAVA